ncbi:MAG: LLM class F420-dependent oxidoreductase [Chloroflexota bacterium]|nr:MAG: LLM class F420-dependent oxidoreductase [Chloroflexota bacterium]
MQLGLQIPSYTWSGGPAAIAEKLVEIARAAEDAGFASIWVMDHFFQIAPMLGQVDDPMFEGYGALSYLAAVTKKVRLGTLVTGVHYRHPGFLIKQVTSLDVLSGGRAYFGVGAGWYERESKGLGFPFPTLTTRFEWLEETLQIAHQLWAKGQPKDVKPYDGRHFQLAEPIISPQPLSKTHPPIMIGGMGEKKTLRMVAQYADACNLFARDNYAELRHKLDVLAGHCQSLGRPYEQIERTSLSTVHLATGESSADDVIERCRRLAEVGIQQAIFNMPNVHEIAPLEQFGRKIIPAVAEF